MTDLNKIHIVHSPLTNNIYLARFGKNPNLALDKRDIKSGVFSTLVQYMMHKAPKGATEHFTLDGQKYKCTLKPIMEAANE